MRAWRDSNPQPSDPWSGSTYPSWWIAFLEWFITDVEAAPNAAVVGIETAGRGKDRPHDGSPMDLEPTTTGLATVTRLWGTHDDVLPGLRPQDRG